MSNLPLCLSFCLNKYFLINPYSQEQGKSKKDKHKCWSSCELYSDRINKRYYCSCQPIEHCGFSIDIWFDNLRYTYPYNGTNHQTKYSSCNYQPDYNQYSSKFSFIGCQKAQSNNKQSHSHIESTILNGLLSSQTLQQTSRLKRSQQTNNLKKQWGQLLKLRKELQQYITSIQYNYLNSRNLLKNSQMIGSPYCNFIAMQLGLYTYLLHFYLFRTSHLNSLLKLSISLFDVLARVNKRKELFGLLFTPILDQILRGLKGVEQFQIINMNRHYYCRDNIDYPPISR